MTTDLDREFFEKKLGWRRKFVRLGGKGYTGHGFVWVKPQKDIFEEDVYGRELPSPSTSWDDFHKWVVPELMKFSNKPSGIVTNRQLLRINLGAFLMDDKTPANAMRWVRKEIPDAS